MSFVWLGAEGRYFFCRCVFCRAFLACCWLFRVRVGTLACDKWKRSASACDGLLCFLVESLSFDPG